MTFITNFRLEDVRIFCRCCLRPERRRLSPVLRRARSRPRRGRPLVPDMQAPRSPEEEEAQLLAALRASEAEAEAEAGARRERGGGGAGAPGATSETESAYLEKMRAEVLAAQAAEHAALRAEREARLRERDGWSAAAREWAETHRRRSGRADPRGARRIVRDDDDDDLARARASAASRTTPAAAAPPPPRAQRALRPARVGSPRRHGVLPRPPDRARPRPRRRPRPRPRRPRRSSAPTTTTRGSPRRWRGAEKTPSSRRRSVGASARRPAIFRRT